MVQLLNPPGPDRVLPGLTIEWRPLYDLLVQTHFHGPRGNFISQESWLQHAQGLANVVVKGRRYFPRGTARDLFRLSRQYLCPHDSVFYRTQAMLALFLPTKTIRADADHAADIPEWLDQFMQMHTWTDRCLHSSEALFHLLSRAAKHSLVGGYVKWEKYMPLLFNHYLQLLDLNVAGSNPHNGRSWPPNAEFLRSPHRVHRTFAKLIVYTLYPGSPTLNLLQQLLMSVATFFHPSNVGRWSNDLGQLMDQLARYYAKRHGKEKRGELKVPKERALDASDTAFVKALLPVAMQALYSKVPALIGAAEHVLRHMSYIHPPSLVLAPVLRQCYGALQQTTSSHRTMSMLSALAQLATPLFHRTLNPSGSAHLEQLLWLTLPGIDPIDPVKTGHTAMWLAMLFCSVPLIDARDPNLITTAAQARAAVASGYNAIVSDVNRLAPSVSDNASLALQWTPTDDDSENEARTATLRFEEWSLAFLQQVINVLNVQDKFAEKSYADVAFLHYLKAIARSFFSAASPAIFVKCADVILKFVLSEHNPNTQKHFGALCGQAASANPTLFLALALPRFFKKLLTTLSPTDKLRAGQKVGDTVLASFGDSELEWYLYLLSQIVKQSSAYGALLPYLPQLFAVYRCSQQPPYSQKKDVQKMGSRVLRSALRSLCWIYPAEYRAFPARYYEQKGWKHWQSWATYATTFDVAHDTTEPDNIEMDWHIPSADELAAATKLASDAITEPLKLLIAFINSPVPAKSASGAAATDNKSDAKMADAKVDSKADVKKADRKAKDKDAHDDDREESAEEKLVHALKQLLVVSRGIHGLMGPLQGAPVFGKADGAADEKSPASPTSSSSGGSGGGSAGGDGGEESWEVGDDRDEALSTSDPSAAWKNFTGKRVPLIRPTHTRLLKDLEFPSLPALPESASTGSDVQKLNFRTYLARFVHLAIQRMMLMPMTQHTIKALCLLIKLARFVTIADGVLENKWNSSYYSNRSTLKWMHEHATGLKCTLRPLLIERAHYLQQRRHLNLVYNSTYTRDVRALVSDLQQLSVNEFSKIRGKAQLVVVGVLHRFPLAADLVLDNTLAVIRRNDSKDEPLLGALGLLSHPAIIIWATRRWRRLSGLLLTLCESASQFSDDKIQLAVQALFSSLYPSVYTLPLRLPTVSSAEVALQSLSAASSNTLKVDSPVPITAQHLAARERSIAGYARSLETQYHRLMRELVTIVNKGLETNKLLDAKLAAQPKPVSAVIAKPGSATPSPLPSPSPPPAAATPPPLAASPAPTSPPTPPVSASVAAAKAAAATIDPTKLAGALSAVAKSHPNDFPQQLIAQLTSAFSQGNFQVLGKLAATLKPEVMQALMKSIAAAGINLKAAAAAAAGTTGGPAGSDSAAAKSDEKDTTPLHWKYHLMASALLFALTNNDTPAVRPSSGSSGSSDEKDAFVTTEDVATFFAKGLVSDLHPLREISMVALVKLLDAHTNALRPADSSVGTEMFHGWAPADEKTANSSSTNSKAVAERPLEFVGRTATRPLAPSAVKMLTTLLTTPGALRKILDTLQHNHPSLHPAVQVGSRTRGAGDVIAGLTVRRYVRSWPWSRFQLSSNAFSSLHSRLIRNLVQTVPELITTTPISTSLVPIPPPAHPTPATSASGAAATSAPAAPATSSAPKETPESKAVSDSPSLIDHFMRLCGDIHEQEPQCTAVEVFAGLARALKHDNVDPAIHAAMKAAFDTRVLPPLRAALAACQPDCVGHWMDGLRYVLFNQSAESLVGFQQILQSATFLDVIPPSPKSKAGNAAAWNVSLTDESPAGQSKRLRFLQPFLIEQAWRTNTFSRAVLKALAPPYNAAQYNTNGLDGFGSLLHSPFSHVRDEVARTLFLMTRNFFTLKGVAAPAALSKADSKSGGEPALPFVIAPTPELDAFLDYCQQLLPIPKPKSADAGVKPASDAEKTEEKRRQNALETSLMWVVCALSSGDYVWAGRIVQAFLPAMLYAAHHPDVQCAALAKYTANLCSWAPIATREQVAAILQTVERVASTADSWHVRVAGLKFLLVFVPRQSLLLTPEQVGRLHKLTVALLADPQVEVRDAAKNTLSSLLLSTSVHDHTKAGADARNARATAISTGTFNTGSGGGSAASASASASASAGSSATKKPRARDPEDFGGDDDESTATSGGEDSDTRFPLGEYDAANRLGVAYTSTINTLITQFVAMASTKLPKVAKGSAGGTAGAAASATSAGEAAAYQAALTKRHAGVLGLSGVVSMHPYDVPRFLPPVLSDLTTHLNDPAVIVTPLRKLLADWRRTISDTWHEVKDKFSSAELEALEGASVAPSYFA